MTRCSVIHTNHSLEAPSSEVEKKCLGGEAVNVTPHVGYFGDAKVTIAFLWWLFSLGVCVPHVQK